MVSDVSVLYSISIKLTPPASMFTSQVHGRSKAKNLRGPLKDMTMKNIITIGYTNSVRSTLLLGGSGGMPPTGKF